MSMVQTSMVHPHSKRNETTWFKRALYIKRDNSYQSFIFLHVHDILSGTYSAEPIQRAEYKTLNKIFTIAGVRKMT